MFWRGTNPRLVYFHFDFRFSISILFRYTLSLVLGTKLLRFEWFVPKRGCSLRTAVPFWGQTTQNLTGLSPKWDCGSKGVKRVKPLTGHAPINCTKFGSIVWHDGVVHALINPFIDLRPKIVSFSERSDRPNNPKTIKSDQSYSSNKHKIPGNK